MVDEQGSLPGAQTLARPVLSDLKITLSTLPPVTPLTVAEKEVLPPCGTVTDAGEIFTLQDFPGGVVGVLVGGMGVFVAPGPEVGVFEGTTPAPQQVATEQLPLLPTRQP